MKTIPRYAIESINYNQLINESRLSPHYEKIAPADSFHAANRGEAVAVDTLTIYRYPDYLHWTQCATC